MYIDLLIGIPDDSLWQILGEKCGLPLERRPMRLLRPFMRLHHREAHVPRRVPELYDRYRSPCRPDAHLRILPLD